MMYHLREWWLLYVIGIIILAVMGGLLYGMKVEQDKAAIQCGNAGGTILEGEYDEEGNLIAWWCLDNNRNAVNVPEWS
jgi:YD repeat-containing protein